MIAKDKRVLSNLSVLVLFSFYLQLPNIHIGFSLKLYMLISVVCAFYILLKKNSYIYLERFDFAFLLFVIWGGITAFWAHNIVSTIKLFIGALFVFSCYLVLKSFLINVYTDNKKLELSFYQASVAFVILSLFMYVLGYYKVSGNYEAYEHVRVFGIYVERGMPRLIGPLLDPNIFTFYICPVFFYTLLKPQKKLFDYLFFTLLCVALILSMSRGGIIAISFATMIILFIKTLSALLRLRLNKSDVFFISLAIITTSIILNLIFSSTDFAMMLERRINDIGSGSGRFEIWENALKLWHENMLLGIGWFNFLDFNILMFDRANYAHNTFIETLVETGLIGFILYLAFHLLILLKIINLVRLNKRYEFVFYSYLAILIQFNSLSLIVNEVFFMFLILLSIFYRNERSYAKF